VLILNRFLKNTIHPPSCVFEVTCSTIPHIKYHLTMKNRWFTVSASPPQKTQFIIFTIKGTQFLLTKLSFVGIRSWSNFQEKAITLEVLNSSKLNQKPFKQFKVPSTHKKSSSNLYTDLTVKTPRSSFLHTHPSSNSKPFHPRMTSFKLISKLDSHTERLLHSIRQKIFSFEGSTSNK